MLNVFDLTPRLLMGPGPSNVAPSVLQAMALPAIGHLDPQFVALMEDIKAMLRQVMLTDNELTIPVSATGSAGMEAAVCNMVAPGDRCVVCVNGVFGARLADVCGRYGGEVVKVEAPWGQPIDQAAVHAALAVGPTRLVGIVHAETSTGVLQPLEEISRIVHEAGALFLVDCVTSLGGHPVKVDEWGIDVCYSGTQKCLSIPPGLAPLSFSPAAMDVLSNRRTKVANWYLDMTMVRSYWGQDRVYHHTAPVNALFGFHEGLRLVLEEGLENRWARHQANHELLVAGLAELGLGILPAPEYRLWSLNAVTIPEGVDDLAVRQRLLTDYDIEIGGGLGDLKGKVWRVGLMGHSSTPNNVNALLGALKAIL
jgi:alanine-glyoxylate transaminase / serine-glyoxylate transaminase / serine-pyruvate transaminase